LLRRPTYKQQFINTVNPLSPSLAFTGSDRARIGHYNDALASAPSEGQALSIDPIERAKIESYMNLDHRFVPAVAETEHFDRGESSGCQRNVPIIKSRRYSLIHSRFNLKTLNMWKSEGCYPEIEKKMGYRLRLVRSEMPQSIARSRPISLKLIVKNDGWASPFNRRGVEIVLRNIQSGKIHKLDVSDRVDPRHWLPEKGEITIDLHLKHQIPTGNYTVLLNLPDPMPSLKNRADYAIQLANNQMWEAATGFNNLNRSLSIK
jgi:hypothetical protein